MGTAPAVVVPVRLHAGLLAVVRTKAAAESTSLSELIRDAVRNTLPQACSDLQQGRRISRRSA